MKTNIKINVLAKEITMTKATAKRISIVGSDEYEQFLRATRDLPDFKVRIATPKTKKARESANKGLTFDLMREIIEVSTENNKTAIEEFEKVRVGAKTTNARYSTPKEYFLANYPEWRDSLLKVERRREEQEKLGNQAKDEERQAAEPTDERKEEQAQAEQVAAVEEQGQKEDSNKRFNMFGR